MGHIDTKSFLIMAGEPKCGSKCGWNGCCDGDGSFQDACLAAQKESCDGKSMKCETAGLYLYGGLVLLIVGGILTLVSCCGCMACCCFSAGAPVTSIKGAAPKADEIVA